MAVVKYKDSTGVVKTLPSVKVNLLDGLEGKALISTENATLSSSEDSTVNGKTRALVKEGTSVWVNANEIDGKVFNYMKNQRNQILSYDMKYSAYIYTDEYIIPVYSDSEIEPKSLTFFQGGGYKVLPDTNKIIFYIGCNILNTDNKTKWGLLMSTKLSDEEMVIGASLINSEITILQTDKHANVRFTVGLPTASFTNHKLVKARAYSIIEKDGVEEIVYSNVITVQL